MNSKKALNQLRYKVKQSQSTSAKPKKDKSDNNDNLFLSLLKHHVRQVSLYRAKETSIKSLDPFPESKQKVSFDIAAVRNFFLNISNKEKEALKEFMYAIIMLHTRFGISLHSKLA